MPNWKKVIVSGSDATLSSLYATSVTSSVVSASSGISGSSIFSANDLVASRDLISNYSVGDEGGQIFLNKPVSNTSITGGINIDVYQNRIRIFENGGTNRGGYWDITALSASVGTNLLTGGGGGSSVTINGNIDNRIVTATGTANTLNGEGNLTFDGSALTVTGSLLLTQSYISKADWIEFTTGSDQPTAIGRIGWNDSDGTLNLGLRGGNVDLLIGESEVAYVYNDEATTLNKGEVVYINGSQGNRISVKRAYATADDSSAGTIGFVAETITSGSTGFVTVRGVLNKLNTTGLIAGALLYLSSSAGQYTTVKPQAPIHEVRLGYVERVHATVGSIYVKVDNGYEIDELHDVRIISGSAGQLLVRSGSVWINTYQLTGSYGLTGSLQADSFTGSLQGTASWATNALTASTADSFIVRNGLVVTGSLSVFTGSAVEFSVTNAGVTIGNAATDIHTISGSTRISGSLNVSGSTNLFGVTGSTVLSSNADTLIITGSFIITGSSTMNGNLTVTGNTTIGDASTDSITMNASTMSLGGGTGILNIDSNTLYVDGANNRIGIGKINPSSVLDVNGNTVITGSLTVSGSSHTITGPINASNITGSLFGTASWASNAVTSITSSRPIAVTGSTIYSTGPISTNSPNTTSSIFLGSGAGSTATAAYNSNFLGLNAGYSASSANNSNFIGQQAGYSASNANASNFLGASAGYGASNANASNFLGASAGYGASSANNSNFLGQGAGNNAINANNSNFLGYGAGDAATNSSHSIFIGYWSGFGASNSPYSTFLGYKTGYNKISALLPGSNNIIIGTNISLEGSRKDSINIGGIIFGTGSYSTITDNTFDAYTGSVNGRIGINVVTPRYTLDVSGSGNYSNGLIVTGSLIATSVTASFTGSLQGTASWATNSITASWVNGNIHNSSNPATSASYALTASYAMNAGAGGGGSVTINNNTSSYIVTATGTANTLTGQPNLTFNGTTLRLTGSLQQSQSLGAQLYGVDIKPTMVFTTGSQTQTALRVTPTFSGSSTFTSSQQNIIADFGAASVGTQFSVNDVTSGSIYMVNDISGLPIIEALSDWTVNMYNYPNRVFQKTSKGINISGSLDVSGSGKFNNGLTVTGSLTVSGSSTLTNIGPAIMSGSLSVSGSVNIKGLTNSVQSNVVSINPTTGQLYYQSSAAGGAYITTQYTGSNVDVSASVLNFTGSGVTVTGGAGTTTINISGGGGGSVLTSNTSSLSNSNTYSVIQIDPALYRYCAIQYYINMTDVNSNVVASRSGRFTLNIPQDYANTFRKFPSIDESTEYPVSASQTTENDWTTENTKFQVAWNSPNVLVKLANDNPTCSASFYSQITLI